MSDLSSIGAAVSALLAERRQRIAVSESSAGGLINAALVAVPGASKFYLGGAVIYTKAGREANMREFARRALELLEACLRKS